MNDPSRTRWTDSRLDDRFDTITSELRALRDVPKGMGELAAELRSLRRDVDGCASTAREHRDDFNAYVEEQDRTHEAHRIERKTDRRWMIGTVLTAAALVVAATGLLLGYLT